MADSNARIRTRNRFLGTQPSNADDGDTDDPELEPQFRKKRKAGGTAEGECAPERADRARRGNGGKLTAAARQALPRSDFALPGKGEGPKGAGSGSYPIPDESHARNALARVSQHGSPEEKAAVRRKVHAKYPDIAESS